MAWDHHPTFFISLRLTPYARPRNKSVLACALRLTGKKYSISLKKQGESSFASFCTGSLSDEGLYILGKTIAAMFFGAASSLTAR
jgi:hypothetical protein